MKRSRKYLASPNLKVIILINKTLSRHLDMGPYALVVVRVQYMINRSPIIVKPCLARKTKRGGIIDGFSSKHGNVIIVLHTC